MGVALLSGVTLGCQSAVFQAMNWPPSGPYDCWFLCLVCLVPWAICLGQDRARRPYLISYVLGVLFYWINTRDVANVTRVGHLALGLYFGLYYLLFAVLVRVLHLRLGRSMTLSVPVAWVCCEFLRGIGPLAFPLMFLSHGVFSRLTLIQISDIFGAYGVSFVVAMINGLQVDVLTHILQRGSYRGLFKPLIATVFVVAATLLYGAYRLGETVPRQGPCVAVLQADYPLSVSNDPDAPRPDQKRDRYLALMDAAEQQQPDLFLFPESPWIMSLNEEFLSAKSFPSNTAIYEAYQRFSRTCDAVIRERAREYQAYVVIGAGSTTLHPLAPRPQDQIRRYNSAFVYSPQGQKQHYDKVVLLMFGEYLPFRNNRWLHFLYRWLDRIHPFSMPNEEFSLTAGTEFKTFDMLTRDGRKFRFGVPICFEDLIPRVSREFARGPGGQKRVDFLLSISNDGWFNHGALVPQHLSVCVFRAVENRLSVARAVNTSCSGFIDPVGRIYDVVNARGRTLGPGIFGYSEADVLVDRRLTWYTRFGDWFGWMCVVLCALGLVVSWWRRRAPGGS